MSDVVCFGEVLWDLLPHGRFLGGAPLNVAYHLKRLGRAPLLVSAVGDDELGAEAQARIARAGLGTSTISRHPTLATGSVRVRLDAQGQAAYEILRPVAWDEIAARPTAEWRTRADGGVSPQALVFGSLALRGVANREVLRAWLRETGALKVCDLNLRPPFDDVSELEEFIGGCALLKVNADEARTLSPSSLRAAGPEAHAAYLAAKYACEMVCVTLGADGAMLWREGKAYRASSPPVIVRDTIGAGDAFTAALLDGLLRDGKRSDWTTLLARACMLGAFVAGKDGAQPEYVPADVWGSSE
jgi:fructokinase